MPVKFSRKCFSFWTLVLLFNVMSCTSTWKFENDVVLIDGDPCMLKTGGKGKCTRIRECTIYIKALHAETMVYADIARCSFEDDFTEIICCPKSTVSKAALVEKRRPSEVACERYKAINPAGLGPLIIRGTKAASGKYPHIAALIYDTPDGPETRCAGSLISERFVLTAAHCLATRYYFIVRLGVTSLLSTSGYDMEIDKKIVHSDYRSWMNYHDIALLKLKDTVTFTHRVKPACLYSNLDDIDSRINLTVIGWGVTNLLAKNKSTELLEATVTTNPLEICNKTYREGIRIRALAEGLNDGQYCAVDEHLNRDSCEGDSGGPLQLFDGRNSTIVGIISFGRLCGSKQPSVYARVAYYLNWIEDRVWGST